MSEPTMPITTRGWLDDYKVGDQLYLWHEQGGWTVYDILFTKVQIVKATKTRLGVSRIDDDGTVRAGIWEIVRGRGRAEWSPYRDEGQEWRPAGSYQPVARVYPITAAFTEYFEARLDEFRKEQGAKRLAKQITTTPVDDLVLLGYDRLVDIQAEIERARANQ